MYKAQIVLNYYSTIDQLIIGSGAHYITGSARQFTSSSLVGQAPLMA
jgi:hypothetical protein